MRKAINALQAAAMLGTTIGRDDIYQITATARPEEIKKLILSAYRGDFAESRRGLDDLLTKQGLSGEDIVGQIYRAIFDIAEIPDRKRVESIDKIGEIDFRITEGANERIQLDALLSWFVLSGTN